MMRTGIVIDERYAAHRNPVGHPERPERIGVLLDLIASYRRDGLVRIAPRHAALDEILANHDRFYVEEVKATAERDHFAFDSDTHTSRQSFDTALLSAGGLLTVLDAVMEGKVDNGMALVRPPGHHAEADRAMGFCLFNNVAIGARYLMGRYGLERILIMDWDVHHGNGTQRSFFASKNVLYISTHQYPYYPGTGAAAELGVAGGMGYTVNLPFPAGFGDREYVQAFHEVVEPVADRFRPEFVLVSAGFDCHELDPLGGMKVTEHGIARMAKRLLRVASDHAESRCALVLEGGYHLGALRSCVGRVLDVLGSDDLSDDPPLKSLAESVISGVRKIHNRFWKI